MRHPDTKLLEFTIKNLRVIIARNKSNHIIKYGKNTMSHFDKKAERIKMPTLNDVISSFEKKTKVDLTDELAKLKEAPNFDIKTDKTKGSGSIQEHIKTKWNIGGKLKEGYYKIRMKLKEIK